MVVVFESEVNASRGVGRMEGKETQVRQRFVEVISSSVVWRGA